MTSNKTQKSQELNKLFKTNNSSLSQTNLNMYQTTQGFSPYKSAFTLQNSITSCKFPQADRFPKTSQSETVNAQLYFPSSSLSSRKTTFGYGIKQILPKYLEYNASHYPACDKYANQNSFLKKKFNTPSNFGLSSQYYYNSVIPESKALYFPLKTSPITPGPGQYYSDGDFGKESKKISMGTRLSMEKKSKQIIETNNSLAEMKKKKNNDIYKLLGSNRYLNIPIKFGTSQRQNITNKNCATPGPGEYKQYYMPKRARNPYLKKITNQVQSSSKLE